MVDSSAWLEYFADGPNASFELRLPQADSIVYATARACYGKVWTQDSDFEHLSRVRYRAKRR